MLQSAKAAYSNLVNKYTASKQSHLTQVAKKIVRECPIHLETILNVSNNLGFTYSDLLPAGCMVVRSTGACVNEQYASVQFFSLVILVLSMSPRLCHWYCVNDTTSIVNYWHIWRAQNHSFWNLSNYSEFSPLNVSAGQCRSVFTSPAICFSCCKYVTSCICVL